MAGNGATCTIKTNQNYTIQGRHLYNAGAPAESVNFRTILARKAEIELLAAEEWKNAQKREKYQRLRAEKDDQRKQIETLCRRIQLQEQKERLTVAARRKQMIIEKLFAFWQFSGNAEERAGSKCEGYGIGDLGFCCGHGCKIHVVPIRSFQFVAYLVLLTLDITMDTALKGYVQGF